ncbi:MAG: hypothetical protein ABID64_03230 [Nitrospirota bacterium]
MNPPSLKNHRRTPKLPKGALHAEAKKTVKALIVTLSLMIVALSIGFFITTNDSTQKGYTLQQQKLKNEHLKSENTSLITKITQATAFSKIESSDKVDEMEEETEKNYVTSEDNSVY